MPEEISVVIWTVSEHDAATCAATLTPPDDQTSSTWRVQTCRGAAGARAALATDETARLCLIYPAPVGFVARAIDAEADPGTVLDSWADAAREMLTLRRQYQDRACLFEAEDLHANRLKGLERLGLHPMPRAPMVDTREPVAPGPVPGLISEALIRDRQDLVALIDAVQDSTDHLSDDPVSRRDVSPEMALEDYRADRQRMAEAERARDSARAEAQAARKHLKACQAELSEKDAILAEQQTRFHQIRKDDATGLLERGKRIAALEDAIRDKDAALGAQRDRAAELEGRVAAKQQELEAREAHIRDLEAKVATLMRSLPMRIRHRLRSLVRGSRRG
ncbi:hypothetical protein [uncultured Roseovarius sp.]|uniref:hypothetical protein n=1 Tax=uncultured Roseovarius sp. TaxID=293344 RepID=UPI00260FAE5C|nr:hypothetical protein [uncultured Roseovarius sp.]